MGKNDEHHSQLEIARVKLDRVELNNMPSSTKIDLPSLDKLADKAVSTKQEGIEVADVISDIQCKAEITKPNIGGNEEAGQKCQDMKENQEELQKYQDIEENKRKLQKYQDIEENKRKLQKHQDIEENEKELQKYQDIEASEEKGQKDQDIKENEEERQKDRNIKENEEKLQKYQDIKGHEEVQKQQAEGHVDIWEHEEVDKKQDVQKKQGIQAESKQPNEREGKIDSEEETMEEELSTSLIDDFNSEEMMALREDCKIIIKNCCDYVSYGWEKCVKWYKEKLKRKIIHLFGMLGDEEMTIEAKIVVICLVIYILVVIGIFISCISN